MYALCIPVPKVSLAEQFSSSCDGSSEENDNRSQTYEIITTIVFLLRIFLLYHACEPDDLSYILYVPVENEINKPRKGFCSPFKRHPLFSTNSGSVVFSEILPIYLVDQPRPIFLFFQLPPSYDHDRAVMSIAQDALDPTSSI